MVNNWWRRSVLGASLIAFLLFTCVVVGRAQQKQYPYPIVRDQRGTVPPGPRLLPSPPLGAGPFTFQTTEQNIRMVVVAKGLSHPWSLAFLPDGSMLITERMGRLRIVRNGVLDPTPVGGDELNVIKPGRNYGWPIVSYGRDYRGPRMTASREGMEEPILFWVPSIATSGLTFYTGDRFPQWKGNVFVGGMRDRGRTDYCTC